MSILNRTLLVCPTLNPGELFEDWLEAFNGQKESPAAKLIIDSASEDGVVNNAKNFGFIIKIIDRREFGHGRTRQKAIDDNRGFEYVIFLTQDAILASPDAIRNILAPFQDKTVSAVCGRQLPRSKAGFIEAHSREYNYPAISTVKELEDRGATGMKAAFLSNSFAAYRVSALNEVGGFPDDVIFGEDMYVAAKMLLSGYRIAYAADACVYHSHDYSIIEEFRRYFDMGVFHAREPWIRQEFGGAEGEGIKFVVSEIRYLLKHAFWQIPVAIIKTLFRYLGFRLGLLEKRLPLWLKRLLSMNRDYFK